MPEAISKSGQIAESLVADEMISSRRLTNSQTRVHMVTRDITGRTESRNLVVFIHGTPGDWTIFSPQLESERLAAVASLVALDRPGWGESEIIEDDGDLSLDKQSRLIGPVLSQLKSDYQSDNLVLVGHSLGGSLVPKIAMDFPELVEAGQQAFSVILTLIQEGIDRKHFVQEDARVLANGAWSMVHGIASLWIDGMYRCSDGTFPEEGQELDETIIANSLKLLTNGILYRQA